MFLTLFLFVHTTSNAHMRVNGKVAAARLGVCQKTLRRMADAGKISHIVPPSGHRRYELTDERTTKELKKTKIAYARVSSASQKDDLVRQVDMLREAYPTFEIVTDVGSGINFKRKGLRSLLERAMRGEVEKVVVAHRDRLARFAFDLLSWFFRTNGVELVVHEQTVDTPEKELVDDLISIVTVFASRTYGRRKYKKRPAADRKAETEPKQEDTDLPDGRRQTDSDDLVRTRSQDLQRCTGLHATEAGVQAIRT